MKIQLVKHTSLLGSISYTVNKQEGDVKITVYKTFGQTNAENDAIAAFISAKKGYPKDEIVLEEEI